MKSLKSSVIVPCYNGEIYIADCIESILNQTKKPNEIIIVDDGSKDNSLSIAKKYPIKIIKHEKNQGLAEARNTGINSTKSDIIIFIDVDFIADKNLVKNILKNYTSKKIAGVGGWGMEMNLKGPANKYISIHGIQWHGTCKKFVNGLFGLCSSFRREVLQETGYYDPIFRTNGEDVDIGYRIVKMGYKLIYDPEIKVYHSRDDKTTNSYIRSVYNGFYYGSLAVLKNKNEANKLLIKSIIKTFLKYFKSMYRDIRNFRFDIFHISIILIKTEIFSALRVYKFYNKKYTTSGL